MNTSVNTSISHSSHTMPAVLTEKIVSLFNFYSDDKIQQGMRSESELYQLALEFQPDDRLKAYQQAYELKQAGLQVVITASTNRYGVWRSLRSPCSEEQNVEQARSDSRSSCEEEVKPIAPGSIGVPRSVMQQRIPMRERQRPLPRLSRREGLT